MKATETKRARTRQPRAAADSAPESAYLSKVEALTAIDRGLELAVNADPFAGRGAVKVERAAHYLECSRSQVYEMLKPGGPLEPVRIGKGKRAGVRVSVPSLIKLAPGEYTAPVEPDWTPGEKADQAEALMGSASQYL